MHLNTNFFISEIDMIDGERPRSQSGTCVPFSKRMFVDYRGGIHPCEKVSRDIPLGRVDSNVNLDFEHCANAHNHLLELSQSQCQLCYRQQFCTHCLRKGS